MVLPLVWSLSARRAWIEIHMSCSDSNTPMSLSARRAWIEISALGLPAPVSGVALRKESVDRNNGRSVKICPTHVALRKESVDRNMIVGFNRIKDLESLSARRAWIEITIYRLILC